MKNFKILLLVGLAGMILFSASSVFAANAKYAYINVAKVFDEYTRTQDDNKALQEEGKQKEQQRDVLVHDIRQIKDELVLLSDDAKAKKQQELDGKLRELQEFDQEAKRELGEKRNVMMKAIFEDIDATVQKFGKRKGLDFIFSDRAILYNNEKFDMTNDVLKELNKGYKKK